MRLAAVLITSLFVVPAHAERCPIPDVDGMRGRFGGAIPAEEDPVCMTALSYLVPLRALEAAAGFSSGAWGLAIQRFASMENVYLAEGARVLIVTAPFLTRYSASAPATVFTLAHELGHAIQRRADPAPWDPSEPEDAQNLRSRRLEAHADALAYGLLARAGFSTGIHEKGLRELFPAAAFLDERPSATAHPSPRIRLHNALRLAQGAYPSPRLEDFDADGRLMN